MKSLVLTILAALILSSCQANNSPLSPIVSSTSPLTKTKATPAATPTPLPTETPVPKLSLNASQLIEQWDLSAFPAEIRARIERAMRDPWHASLEDKNIFDDARIQGIVEQTGDPSYGAPLPVDADPERQKQLIQDEINKRIRKYVEYLWSIRQRENPPLPFAWREINLGDPSNYSIINTNAPAGYEAEGYGPMFG